MLFVFGALALPLIEIALFVVIGGQIGLWATLAWVVLTGVAGFALMRAQGARAVTDLRRVAAGVGDPAKPLADGAVLMFAGLMLVLPGFLTDAVGLALLLPPVRAWLLRSVRARVSVRGFGVGPRSGGATRPGGYEGPGVIDGEFHEIEPGSLPPRGPSGWTRH